MNNNSNSSSMNTLDEMRDEMKKLREALATQQLIGNRLMRDVMVRKSSWGYRAFKFKLFFLLPLAVFELFRLKSYGMSWFFVISTMLFMAVDIWADARSQTVRKSDFSMLPLVELQTKLVRQRHRRRLYMVVSAFFGAGWMVWLGYELSLCRLDLFVDLGWGIGSIVLLVGFSLGMGLSLWWYRKMQRIDADIIAEINDLKSES